VAATRPETTAATVTVDLELEGFALFIDAQVTDLHAHVEEWTADDFRRNAATFALFRTPAIRLMSLFLAATELAETKETT
jgi:hypothetical protein